MKLPELIDWYVSFLKEQGYSPQSDEEIVSFKMEGASYIILVDDKDPLYFRLLYPNFYQVATAADRIRLFEAGNEAMQSTKTLKIFIREDRVWAAAEYFLSSRDGFKEVFVRALNVIQLGVGKVTKAMAPPASAGAGIMQPQQVGAGEQNA